MTTDVLKIAADKYMALAHGFKLAGDSYRAAEHTQIAYYLNAARKIMEELA